MNLKEKYDKVYNAIHDNNQKFEELKNKRSLRKDLHAFLLLDELFPKTENAISHAAHDHYYLNYTSKEINTLSEQHLFELILCHVLYDEYEECLFFVT
jgi:hypothetical protein